ncbi:hypothetical protein CRENBAI_012724 [Crenichthys baileyi]|uniref:Uncharacterized protein n=1 Tax=Crenichthys baileyi TaxID=28760 RepID=A0AAV9RYF4_9TELE
MQGRTPEARDFQGGSQTPTKQKQNKHPTRVGGGGLERRARVQAVPGRSGDQQAGDVGAADAGDVGTDDLTAGGGTRRTHGGAQRCGAEITSTQARGVETAGTFGEALKICGRAAEAQRAKRLRPHTPQGQEQEVETGPPQTNPEREPGMEAVRPRSPPGQDQEQEQEVEAVYPRAPHGQEQSVRAAWLGTPPEQN